MSKIKKLSVLKLEKKETKEILGGYCSYCDSTSNCSCSSSMVDRAFGAGYGYNRINDIYNN